MKVFNLYIKVSLLALILFTAKAQAQVSFKTSFFKISLGKQGELTELTDVKSQRNYLYSDEKAYLLSVKIDDKIIHPNIALWQGKSSMIELTYPGNILAQVRVAQNG